jgi:hypothetical protein
LRIAGPWPRARRRSSLARIASAIVRYSARFGAADEIGAGAEAATGALSRDCRSGGRSSVDSKPLEAEGRRAEIERLSDRDQRRQPPY